MVTHKITPLKKKSFLISGLLESQTLKEFICTPSSSPLPQLAALSPLSRAMFIFFGLGNWAKEVVQSQNQLAVDYNLFSLLKDC